MAPTAPTVPQTTAPAATEPPAPEPTNTPAPVEGTDQHISIGIDQEALAAAIKAAEGSTTTNPRSESNTPTIRAIPALIAATGTTTTGAAVAAGTSLGPLGLGAVAAGTAVITVGTLVANRSKTGGNSKTGTRGATGRTSTGSRSNSGFGGGSRRTGRSGSSSLGSSGGGRGRTNSGRLGGKNNSASSLGHGSAKGKHGKNTLGSTGSPSGAKAKHGAQLLAAQRGTNPKGKNAPHRGGGANKGGPNGGRMHNGGGRNKGGGKGSLSSHGSTGAGKGAMTRAALKKASTSPTARALGSGTVKAAKALGRTIAKTPVGKLARAARNGVNKAVVRPLRNAATKAWNSRAGQTLRAAATRLGRASKEHLLFRPKRAMVRALGKIWRRIRPGRGTYAHAARTALIGLWSAACGILSLLAVFGWFRTKGADGKPGAPRAWHIVRGVWRRLMARSRKRRNLIRRTDGLTMHVEDSGASENATAPSDVDPSDFEIAAAEIMADYLSIESTPDMDRIAAEYRGLGDGIRSYATGVHHLAHHTNQHYPLPEIIQRRIQNLLSALEQASSFADDFWINFSRIHADDLARYDEPRRNEQMWNVVPVARTDGGGVRDRPSHFAQSCAQMPERYKHWKPASPEHAIGEFSGVGSGLNQIAAAVQRLRDDALDIQPVHSSVPDQLNTLVLSLVSCASTAGQVSTQIRVHVEDMRHAEAEAAAEAESNSDAK
ncbi:hypothetical protein ACWGIR_30965 [Streptomyces albidoflavus]